MTSRLLCILTGLGIALAVAGSTHAAIAADPPKDPCKSDPPVTITVTDVYKVGDPTKKETKVELGNEIAVQLDNSAKFHEEATCRKKDILLYLNGQATGNKEAGMTGKENNALIFFLRHVGATHDFWDMLLGRPNFDSRPLHVSVGIEGQAPLTVKDDKNLSLTVLPPGATLFWFVIFLALCIGFFKIARQSTILRDQLLDPDSPGQLGAYSLSKMQGAWWFFFILASYLLIGIVTGDFSNSINSTAVILLGIGAGTVLGSAAIDASKIDQRKDDLKKAKAERAALGTGTAVPAALDAKIDALNGKSVNFIQDILSDGNGVNFHRFQLAVWTLVLSIVFVTQVYIELDMPTFNQTLMGLLGLSAGTYLGLKIPEPTKPTP
jgi:hypothetical protein